MALSLILYLFHYYIILSCPCGLIFKIDSKIYHTQQHDPGTKFYLDYYASLLPILIFILVFLYCIGQHYFSNISHICPMHSNDFLFYMDLCNQIQVHYQDLWGLTQSVLGILYSWQLLHLSGLSYCVPATMTDEVWTLHTYPYICAFVLDIPSSKCCPLILDMTHFLT